MKKIIYSKNIIKKIKKGRIPKEVWIDFRDAFQSFTETENFRIFDIKKMTQKKEYVYYRMRLGKFRALFHMNEQTICVEDIATRGEVYKK